MEIELPIFMPKAEGTAEVKRDGEIIWAEGTKPEVPESEKDAETQSE